MEARSSATTIDEYIAEFPDEVQRRLQEVRRIVHETAPDAAETIAYAIPTFDYKRKHLVHFGGFAHHIGFYPTPSGMEEFDAELSTYKRGMGSAQFPLDEPLPVDLIRAIVKFRLDRIDGGSR